MSERRTSGFDSLLETDRSQAATALFALGVVTVAANSALYFFGVEFAHPAISLLGLALLLPLVLRSN